MRYAVIAVLLAGCAGNWTHASKSEQEYKSDKYECDRDAMSVGGGLLAFAMIDQCMEAKGWAKK